MNRKVITVTPAAASFATPYSSGDVIGGVNTVPAAMVNPGSTSKLDTVVVIDLANQKAALDVVFFDAVPASSIGADNAAYALADADAGKEIGRISILTTDYVSSGALNAEATIKNVELTLQSKVGLKDIYCAVIARGAVTYGSAADLSIKLGMEQDG